jgi:3-oxoacyl-[acyl-carrier-protein] synthase II
MYITGIGWITTGGRGKGWGNSPFVFTEGVLLEIKGDRFPENPAFRKGRLDRFSMLGLETITLALYDAGLEKFDIKSDTGIIASTVYGCLTTDLEYNETLISENGGLPDPNLFTHTLPNIFLGYAAMLYNLTGPNYILYEKTNSGLSALDAAMECITQGECDAILAGICDVEPSYNKTISDKFRPGAVFMMIENKPCDKQYFGKLSTDESGNIYLNNNIVKDIESCVRDCIKQAYPG